MRRFLVGLACLVSCFVSAAMVTIESINMCTVPVFAADAPSTSIIKCDSYEGADGVTCILNIVLTILTYGVGILGVLGIVISGIQYITSQGDPARMTKAKNRIIQVIIGLAVYAVMWAALRFLVPGFQL